MFFFTTSFFSTFDSYSLKFYHQRLLLGRATAQHSERLMLSVSGFCPASLMLSVSTTGVSHLNPSFHFNRRRMNFRPGCWRRYQSAAARSSRLEWWQKRSPAIFWSAPCPAHSASLAPGSSLASSNPLVLASTATCTNCPSARR